MLMKSKKKEIRRQSFICETLIFFIQIEQKNLLRKNSKDFLLICLLHLLFSSKLISHENKIVLFTKESRIKEIFEKEIICEKRNGGN